MTAKAKARASSNVIELNSARRRGAKTVAAARVISIDYRSIVDNAVAGLADNNPDARRGVYAQARNVVRRHLMLMRLPAPIVELEQLSLDLTIRRVERQWRARENPEPVVSEPPETRRAADHARDALGAMRSAIWRFLLRPIGVAVWALLWPLRFILRPFVTPLGLALTAPVVAIAVIVVFFVDNGSVYTKLSNSSASRWLSQLDLTAYVPSWPFGKADDQVAADDDGAPPDAAPAADYDTAALPQSPPYRGATKVRPIRADLSGLTAAPMPEPASIAAPAAAQPASPTLAQSSFPAAGPLSAPAAFPAAGPPAPPLPTRAATPIAAAPVAAPVAIVAPTPVAAPVAPPMPAAPPVATQPAIPEVTSMFDAQASAQPLRGPAVCADIPWQSDQVDCALSLHAEDSPGPRARWLIGYEAITDFAAAHPLVPGEAVAAAPWPGSKPGAVASAPQPAAPVARTANAKVAGLIDSGRKWSNRGDLDHAVHDFNEAIRLDPKNPEGYHERGQAMFKMGETERAIADYSAAIQRDPQFGGAIRSRGMAYLYRGSSDLALADLSKAIALAEADPSTLSPIELFYARRSRAQIYSSKQQYALEVADCTAVIESYSRDPSVAEELKQNYADVGAANVIATVYRQRATAYIRQSNWEAALADLTSAIPLSYDHGFAALVDRSKIHEGLGQRDQAIADLQSALAVRPGSEEVRLALRRLGVAVKPALPINTL